MASELARAGMPFGTVQPSGRYVRKPQDSEFFTHIHQFIPGTTTGWTTGAVNIRDSFNIDGDSDFDVIKQAILGFDEAGLESRGDTLAFEVSPVSEGFNFSETYVSQYGTGPRPNQLRAGMRLPRSGIFTALASNRAPLLDTLLIAHFGAKKYVRPFLNQRVYRQQKGYTYPATFASWASSGPGQLAAGATAITTLRTDGDSDFDVQSLTVVSGAPVLVQIMTDERRWFQRAIRSELLGGSGILNAGTLGYVSGEYPFFLPVPRLIYGAGYINVQVTNTDVVNPIDCQVAFRGTRLYPAGGLQ